MLKQTVLNRALLRAVVAQDTGCLEMGSLQVKWLSVAESDLVLVDSRNCQVMHL